MRGRPFGSRDSYRRRRQKDLKPRKPRSDRKHDYVKRDGKWFRKKIRKSVHKTLLKIHFWQIRNMSYSGFHNWNSKARLKLHKFVYVPLLRVDLEVDRISSIAAIKETALEVIGYEGKFIMRGFSHGKTKSHYKQVRLAVIEIRQHADGLRAYVSETARLSRYWFWNKF